MGSESHHTLVRRSHEHRALHGVSRAWHAAGHTAVVAGAVVAGLRRRVGPPFRAGVAGELALMLCHRST
jgi:hypothetical protein